MHIRVPKYRTRQAVSPVSSGYLFGVRFALAAAISLSVLAASNCSWVFADEIQTTPAQVEAASSGEFSKGPLEGRVSVSVYDGFSDCINQLVEQAEKNDADYARLDDAVSKYSTVRHRVGERTSDALNYTLMFKGIAPSSEGGDIILGEKDKLKGLASAKYQRQKLDDDIHLKVVSNFMQLAMGIGNNDDALVQEAKDNLGKLVGTDQTDKAISFLTAMRDHESTARLGTKSNWSPYQLQKRVSEVVKTAAVQDPIVDDIQKDVHHFNKHGRAAYIAHRTIRVALSAVSLSPSLVGPAAQAILFGYLAVSGGTEQEKLLRELYLDKRLTSRSHLLTEEAHMAVDNYQIASLTNNKLLMSCSEQLIARMTNPSVAAKVLSAAEPSESTKAQ